jgi:DNA-binding response OmpR family regulator
MAKKIFIIEDDANLLYGLQAKLRVEDFDVVADEGIDEIEVLKRIKTTSPDYIILDLILPHTDGFEMIKKIKGDESLKNIPIFIFSNLSDNDTKTRSMDLGAEQFFIKNDFSIDEFVEKIKKIIINKSKI